MRYLFKNNKNVSNDFSRNHRRAGNKNTKIVIAICVVMLVSFIWPSFVKTPLMFLGRPLWKLEKGISESSIISSLDLYFTTKRGLNNKVKELEVTIDKLKSQTVELAIIKQENDTLNDFFNRTNPVISTTFAYIIGRPNKTAYDTFLLDVGLENEVRAGDIISYDGKNILGEIVSVSSKTSTARLFSSPNTKSDVVISDSLATTAVGVGGGNFEITLPREIIVDIGMIVRLEQFPNTTIGYIESIEKRPSDSFQRILVRSNVNIYEIEGLLIYHK